MTHLIIENQNSNTEIVSTTIILKLYEMALSAEGDVSLKGNLLSDHARLTAYDYLTGNLPNTSTKRFPNLTINLTGGAYIDFTDLEVERVLLADNIGDGVGISQSDILQVTSLGNMFDGNTVVRDLSCLSQFTSVTSMGGLFCRDATSLTTVSFPPNLTTMTNSVGGDTGGSFNGCTSLLTVILSQNLTNISTYAFYGCTSLQTINLPSTLTRISADAFYESGLTSIMIPNTVTQIGTAAFKYSSNLSNITFEEGGSEALTISGSSSFAPGFAYGCASNLVVTFPNVNITIGNKALTPTNTGNNVMTTYIFKSTSVPTVTNSKISEERSDVKSRLTIYVPDTAVNDYKTATGFAYFADCIHSINEYNPS